MKACASPMHTPTLPPSTEPPPLAVRDLGTVPYGLALELQRELVRARQNDEVPDTLLLLEHPPVITLGSRGGREHVLAAGDLEVFADVGRGGDVTYHGPGQRVCYPVLLLRADRRDLHRYLRDLESALIEVLAVLGLAGECVSGRTGVWIGDAKIAAIGIRVARWVTSHGLALNVSRQVHEGFRRIVPCGLEGAAVTSLEEQLGLPPDAKELDSLLARCLARALGRRLLAVC